MTIVFKHPGYPEKKWRKGFKIAGGFPGTNLHTPNNYIQQTNFEQCE